MTNSLSQLLEESFQIAWEYLERTGELSDGAVASRFLSDTIETMIRQGQRSRLLFPIALLPLTSDFEFPDVPQRLHGRKLVVMPAARLRNNGSAMAMSFLALRSRKLEQLRALARDISRRAWSMASRPTRGSLETLST